MCSVGDLEPAVIWTDSEVRARKAHKCDGCDGPIRPGEKYIRHASLCDGAWTNEKQCPPCFSMSKDFADAEGHMRGPPSMMRELLKECVDYEGADEADQWVRELAAMDARRAEAGFFQHLGETEKL